VVERRTTLTWIKKDLPAAGKAYTFLFSFGMPPLPVGEEGSFFASAQKPTIVIESWTAGTERSAHRALDYGQRSAPRTAYR